MTRVFRVDLPETSRYRDRFDAVQADRWYVDGSGALVFVTSGEKVAAFGPREWAKVQAS